MADYYFLATLLPQLEIGHIPTLGFSELMELFRVNLKKEDQAKVISFLRIIDIENMRRLWANEPLDPRGTLSQEELEASIHDLAWQNGEEFPSYMQDFLERYPTPQERVEKFSFLMGNFLEKEATKESGFLRNYFSFERELRLVMAGYRARVLQKKLEAEFQFEESSDPIVAQILAQKDAKSYEPPFEFKELKPIFEQYGEEPLALHKALTAYRFEAVWELMHNDHFSIDRILGYLAQLILVEKWLELDVQEGIKVVNQIEENVQ